eukprot:GHVT01079491.1.p1 GENE.GHVT01079491.1~~GHVT01079491.1.p1  ORF type:complete len:417 (+),score=16.24 GHVT01079491.1:170-1420(+)
MIRPGSCVAACVLNISLLMLVLPVRLKELMSAILPSCHVLVFLYTFGLAAPHSGEVLPCPGASCQCEWASFPFPLVTSETPYTGCSTPGRNCSANVFSPTSCEGLTSSTFGNLDRLCITTSCASCAIRCAERHALVQFYRGLGGDEWVENFGWAEYNSSLAGNASNVTAAAVPCDPCIHSWHGITCDRHGRVLDINLANNRLRGTLSEGFFPHLQHLEHFVVHSILDHGYEDSDRNFIQGGFPSDVYTSSSLRSIEASGNEFSSLPLLNVTLGYLSALEVLSFSFNRLTNVPSFVWNLPSLRILELQDNQLIYKFPSGHSFAGLPLLEHLDISNNNISGTLPSLPISQLSPFLQSLDLSDNSLLSGNLTALLFLPVHTFPDLLYVSVWNTSIHMAAEHATCESLHFCFSDTFRAPA